MAKANKKSQMDETLKNTPKGALSVLLDSLETLKAQNKTLCTECNKNKFIWLGLAYENVDKVIDKYIEQVKGAM